MVEDRGDGVSIEEIEKAEGGVEALVEGLHQELRTKSYRPEPSSECTSRSPTGGSARWGYRR